MEETFLVVVRKGVSGLLVYMHIGLRSFFITLWRATFFLSTAPLGAIQTDVGPSCVSLKSSSSSGLLLKTIPWSLSCPEEFPHKYRDKVYNIRTTMCF